MISQSAKALAGAGRQRSDVLIVGSGGGGAVTAYHLARAGWRVTVLEAGPHIASAQFTEHMPSALEQLYADQGAQTNADGDVTILQGRCLGGSTVVNATAAFRIPPWILARWRDEHGIEGFSDAELEPLYRQIESDLAIHVNQPHEINRNSQLMTQGAQALGWHVAPLARNVRDCVLSGYCVQGCRYDRKQSMLVSYLPWAQARGARIVCDAPVSRIRTAEGRVNGVTVQTDQGEIEFDADLVIVAAGAIGSPLLLQDSGLGGDEVGRHFACHPSLAVAARFDAPVQMWSGAQLGVYCAEFDADEKGGFLLEGGGMEPAATAALIPGEGAELSARLKDLDQTAAMVCLVHDEGAGRVHRVDGQKRIDYRLTDIDRQRARDALRAAARIWFAAGAREVYLPTTSPTLLSSPDDIERIDSLPMGPGQIMFTAYHPQGSCRMGADPARSVVRSSGQVHGWDNLVVADASLFPTSVLVNTQLPVYVTAARIAQRIIAEPGRYGL